MLLGWRGKDFRSTFPTVPVLLSTFKLCRLCTVLVQLWRAASRNGVWKVPALSLVRETLTGEDTELI